MYGLPTAYLVTYLVSRRARILTRLASRLIALVLVSAVLPAWVTARRRSPIVPEVRGSNAPIQNVNQPHRLSSSRLIGGDVAVPTVSRRSGIWTVVVPRRMTMALANWDRRFAPFGPNEYQPDARRELLSIPNHVPWAALDLDVNGDRQPDLIMVGHTDDVWGLVAVVSQGGSYRVTLLEPRPWPGKSASQISQYVLIRDGREIEACDGTVVRATGASFGLTSGKGGPVLHYLSAADARWKTIDTSC